MTKLVIIVPCYNEEEVLHSTARQLKTILAGMIDSGLITQDSRICFVNDGSKDKTQDIIENLCKSDMYFAEIKLAANFGHQYALLAGMNTIDCDAAITIDADLQDDCAIIPDMVRKYLDGFDVVYGVRNRRDTDTFFKKNTAVLFYKLMEFMGVKIVFNHADFRLLSKKALTMLGEYKERNVFLRGIIPLIGLNSCKLYYDRAKRSAGESKYPLKKMLAFAWTGITGFSTFPLKIITFTGALCIMAGLMWWIILCGMYFTDREIPSAGIILSFVVFFSGIITLSLGIVGEYTGKILSEVKQRPRYQIDKRINI